MNRRALEREAVAKQGEKNGGGTETMLISTTRVHSLKIPKARHRQACLLFVTGADAGRLLSLNAEAGEIVIGRGEDADIYLDSPEVSRYHARIELEQAGEHLTITDLGSKNSTFVNDEPVDKALLRADDKIRIGPYVALKLTYLDDEELRLSRDLYERAVTDPLTGVFNRRFLTMTLEREWSFARRHEQSLSLAMLDIDRFKAVNDTHGHLVGDEILCQVVKRIQKQTRLEDLLGRYGGDEFVLLLRQSNLVDAKLVAERIRRTIQTKPFVVKDKKIPITVSVGVASFDHPKLTSHQPESLIHEADERLLEAKESGRNRVCG